MPTQNILLLNNSQMSPFHYNQCFISNLVASSLLTLYLFLYNFLKRDCRPGQDGCPVKNISHYTFQTILHVVRAIEVSVQPSCFHSPTSKLQQWINTFCKGCGGSIIIECSPEWTIDFFFSLTWFDINDIS